MKTIQMLMTTITFMVVACQEPRGPNSAGLGGVDIPGVEMAFGGYTGDNLVFVVLSTLDGMDSGGKGAGVGGGPGMGPEGAYWQGYHQDEKNHRWEWRVKNGKARFGQQEFSLTDGEVFIMSENFSVQQIPGSKAGPRSDESNLQRLSELFRQSISEQDVAPKSSTRSESKLEGSNKSQPESEARSQ